MSQGAEYPKATYKDGGADLIWGKPVQTRVVMSEDEELEALEGGWRLSPVDDSKPAVKPEKASK